MSEPARREPLFDTRMSDGTRHFAALPESSDWDALREHLSHLKGARVTDFVTDHVTEAWIDFDYCRHTFSANNQHGEWWFFVQDPACPDAILEQVLAHCARLLVPHD